MEIGDHLTNVLAINDLASLHYKYLECPLPESASVRTTVSSIVSTWRQFGCLVAQDATKLGIWLFGSDGGKEPLIPSSVTADSSGVFETQNISLLVKKDETYTYEAIKSLVKTLMNPATPTGATANSSSPAIAPETNMKNAQVINTKAAGNNSVLGINRESAANGIKKELLPLGPGPEVIDHLLSAILASLSYHLCQQNGFIALNSRTLVMPDSERIEDNDHYKSFNEGRNASNRSRLLTLGLDMTSIGTLIVKASISYSTYYSSIIPAEVCHNLLPGIPEGTIFFLAPGGKVARYVSSTIHESDLEHTANADMSSDEIRPRESPDFKKTIDRWKRRCTTWLVQKGLNTEILDGGLWYLVQVSIPANLIQDAVHDAQDPPIREQLVTLPWPASLCFRPVSVASKERSIQWSEDDYDPLNRAGGWYKHRTDRDAISLKRKKERETVEAAIKVQADSDARNLSANNYSPAALRRASVAGMVYPTPPDGVQHTIGATPSFDGNVSTPGHPNLQLSNMEGENVTLIKAETSSEHKPWDSSVSKREQQNPGPEFSNNGNENLFGEMDEDLFGENDITDADFSFFDEPDVVQDDGEVGLADEMMHNGLPDTNSEGRPSVAAPAEAAGNGDRVVDGLETVDEVGVMQQNEVVENFSPARDGGISEPTVALKEPNNALKGKSQQIQPRPPLSPELIFKRLSVTTMAQSQIQGKTSGLIIPKDSFEGVDFDPSISSFNGKYAALDSFIFQVSHKAPLKPKPLEIPTTEYLSRKRKRTLPSPDILLQAFSSTPTPGNIELVQTGFYNHESTIKASQEESSWSDPDDSSSTAENGPLIQSTMKRKRTLDIATTYHEDQDDVASSFQSLNMDLESPIYGHEALDFLNPNFLDSDPADWALRRFLTFPELPTSSNALADDEFVAAAQVLGDQAVGRSFQVAGLKLHDVSFEPADCRGDNILTSSTLEHIISATKPYFAETVHCDLNAYLDLRGAPLLHQINRNLPARPGPTPRTMLGDPSKQSAIFLLPPPHLEVCRSDSKLTVLPSAVPFWETLGLGPCRGGKDVLALCMYPSVAGLRGNVHIFLEHLRSAYEAGRFGTHEPFPNAELVDTEFPIELGGSTSNHTPDFVMSTLRERFSYLAGELATTEIELEGTMVEDKNIVVYFVYDPEKPELLLPICAGFHHMFETYQDALAEKKTPVSNELVLQLVPMNLFDTPTSIGVPPPLEYARMAMEVYDRCVDITSGQCIPSIILEQPLPRIIDFKQTPNPSASLLRENSSMHIAYAQSIDDRWVTAAWTDSTGTQQFTASYCLGRKGSPITRVFSDIAHEIWQTTLGIIAARKITWRIMIVKCGVMDVSELEFWKGLASTESNAHVSLTLLTVDTEPSLQLLPSSVTLPPNTLSTQTGLYTTPVSTPQASILSPDQSGNVTTPVRDSGPTSAATPGDSNAELKIDADATLLDITDQSWGAILSHRINNSNSLLLMNATLVSGYLIKRGGPGPSDVPLVIEVNLVHSEGNPRIYDAYLREILGFYRGLATVARARGVVDHVRDGRPWHVAAAEKAVRALYLLA